MGDYHVRMQFDIDAEPKEVREAIATRNGVASWWSTATEGDPGQPGGRLQVSFPDVPQPFQMEVVTSSDERLEWRVGDFPPWWAGTTIRWDVTANPEGAGTRLLFSHRDFDPANEVIPVITPAWAQIVLRLKGYAETGTPQPFFEL